MRGKRANYVRSIKNAISSTFGKVHIGEIPGNRATVETIINWKTSSNVKWAKENLWNPVDDNDRNDTYMKRILDQVFKAEKCTTNNCAFVIAVVELIFDPNVQTTSLSGEMIIDRMNKKLKMHSNEEV